MFAHVLRPAKERWAIRCVFCYAFANVLLYSLLMPLWEGFDEPFHYGYVQHLSTTGMRLPVLGRTTLSAEVWSSLTLVPVSRSVKQNLPELTTFDEFRSLDDATRAERRLRLMARSAPGQQSASGGQLNYEAHQAPLAYVVLALADKLLCTLPIVPRVVILRIIAGTAAVLLVGTGVGRLGAYLKAAPALAACALFAIFSTQMFYASVARVSNDWLAVGIAPWLVVAMIDFARRRTARPALGLGATLAAGLLAKAYYLALAPGCAVMLCLVRKWKPALICATVVVGLAGPWYARNLALYGSLTAMQESVAGIDAGDALAAAAAMPWPHALIGMARSSLWTGNNHFTTFSLLTIDILLLLAGTGLALFFLRSRRRRPAETVWPIAGFLSSFALALIYAALVASIATAGASSTASAWYTQPMLVVAIPCVLLGLAEAGPAGRGGGVVYLGMNAYVLMLTYAAKLVPLYAGVSDGRASAASVFRWHFSELHATLSGLRFVACASPELIYGLMITVCAASVILGIQLGYAMLKNRGRDRCASVALFSGEE